MAFIESGSTHIEATLHRFATHSRPFNGFKASPSFSYRTGREIMVEIIEKSYRRFHSEEELLSIYKDEIVQELRFTIPSTSFPIR
jgi:hypothetical protein